MNVPGWLMMNIYSFVIGFFIFSYTRKNASKKMLQTNIYTNLTALLMILIIADTMGRIPATNDLQLFILRAGSFLI